MKANDGIDPHEPIDYRRQLVERWAEVIATAWSNRQPASLEVVLPRLEGVAFNRRYWMKDGSTGWIPRKGDTNIFRPAGPVDTDFPFLLARRAGSAEGLGSLAIFAMHTAVYGGRAFGAEKSRELGPWLGRPYGKFDNVLWVLGGDNDPNNARAAIRALGLGLNDTAPPQLITYHAASTHSSTDLWPAHEHGGPAMRHLFKHSPFVGIPKEFLPWRCGRPCFALSL